MDWSIFISNILLHVGIMALFLTTFFFTIAAIQEKAIVENQINFILDDFLQNTFGPISDSDKKLIKNNLDIELNKVKQDLKKEDEKVKKLNNETTKNAFIFVGIILAVVIVLVLFQAFIFKWNLSNLKFLGFSVISSLIFVAITETLFLFIIAKGYYSVDPNQIKKRIVDNLLK
jgi:multisubunit Na+/H+ antiporter MnhG subunit